MRTVKSWILYFVLFFSISTFAHGNSQPQPLHITDAGIVEGTFDDCAEQNQDPAIRSACTGYCEGGVIPNCILNRDSWMPPPGGCCPEDWFILCGNETCRYSVSGCCGACPAPGPGCYNPPETCCKTLAICNG